MFDRHLEAEVDVYKQKVFNRWLLAKLLGSEALLHGNHRGCAD